MDGKRGMENGKLIPAVIAGVLFVFALTFLVFWFPNKKYTCQGESEDLQNLWIGRIKYAGASDGYEFWFTPYESRQWYVANHSYHNIYQLTVDDSGQWCRTTVVPDRQPYNLVGHTGETVYWKSIDIANGEMVCPSKPVLTPFINKI